jgi:putrescine aminotransferase
MGMIGAIELVRDKDGPIFFQSEGETGALCRDHCLNNGLMMRPVRDAMVLSPPLVITYGEVDRLIEIARLALDLTQRDLYL